MTRSSKHYIIKAGDFTVADARRNPGMDLAISRWVDKAVYDRYSQEQKDRSEAKALIEIDAGDTVTLDAGSDARPRFCLCKVIKKVEVSDDAATGDERLSTIYTVFLKSMGVAPKKCVRESAVMTIY